ncbi:MAG: hypothetical protein ABI689_08130 [Thermoanaerobaculia bacterium]
MKLRRRHLFLLAGLALGELFYVGAFEWVARSGQLAGWINRRPDRVRMEFAAAHSYFPFLVTLQKLDLAVQTARVQWHLTADETRGWIAPLPLLARRFRVETARAVGVEFAVRRRFDTAGEPLPPSEFLPAIGEFAGEQKPPRTGTLLRPVWSFEFPRLTAHEVRSLWLEQLRVTGEMEAKGGFSIRRRLQAEVEASRIEVQAGTLTLAGQPLAGEVRGSVAISSVPYEYRDHRGLAALPYLDAAAQLDGTAFAGTLLRNYLARMPWIEFEDAQIPFHADLKMRRGTLVAGSSFSTEKAPQAVQFFGFEARGTAMVRFDVRHDTAGERAELDLRYDDFELRRSAAGLAVVAGSGLSLFATTRDLRAGGLPDDGRVRLDLGQAHVVDLAGFSDLFPPSAGLVIAGGKGEVHGRLDVDRESAKGAVAARLTRVKLVSNGVTFTGGLALDLPIVSHDLSGRQFDLAGAQLVLTDFLPSPVAGAAGNSGSTAKPEAPGWWGRVTLERSRLHLVDPASAQGRFSIQMRDSIPLVRLYASRKDLPGWFERLLEEPDVQARGEYSYTRPELRITGLAARFEHWGFAADLELGKETRRGLLLIEWRKLAVGVRMEGEKRTFKLAGAREWFAKEKL